MTVHSGLLAEVLSDWGLLELLLGELRKRAKIIRKAGVPSAHSDLQQLPCVEDSDRLLTASMLQVVSNLTLRSIKNTGMHLWDFNNRIPCFPFCIGIQLLICACKLQCQYETLA